MLPPELTAPAPAPATAPTAEKPAAKPIQDVRPEAVMKQAKGHTRIRIPSKTREELPQVRSMYKGPQGKMLYELDDPVFEGKTVTVRQVDKPKSWTDTGHNSAYQVYIDGKPYLGAQKSIEEAIRTATAHFF